MIKFDVGANTGAHTESLASDGSVVYAFEPSSLLYPALKEKFRGNQNIRILPFAVDIDNGFKTFNASDVGDRGVGSLYDFHPDLGASVIGQAAEFTTPPIFKELVPTIRLDTFMEVWNIPEIDYLHIDAQGNDFNTIKSLGNKIHLVKEGQLECTLDIPLYSDVDNYHEHVVKYLEDRGFIVQTLYIHDNRSEVDLHFLRK